MILVAFDQSHIVKNVKSQFITKEIGDLVQAPEETPRDAAALSSEADQVPNAKAFIPVEH